ncbi:MAG: CAP domain-containing protein [Actinomycetota bacterium]
MATPFEATAAPTAKEQALLDMVNRARHARGLAPLALRDDLVRMAHRHSAKMARRGVLYHHGCLACRFPSGSWQALAENVGTAGSLRRIHRMMMGSAAHRVNILGGFDAVGLGVVKRGGRYWVTEIFFA